MRASKRTEFSKAVRLEIFKRAGGPENTRCETCGLFLRGKAFEVDHTVEEWELDHIARELRGPLTAADGKLLGKDCCHKAKSAKKAGERAKGKRIVEKLARIDRRPTSSGQPGFSKRYRKRMDGSVVDKETGEIIRKGRT